MNASQEDFINRINKTLCTKTAEGNDAAQINTQKPSAETLRLAKIHNMELLMGIRDEKYYKKLNQTFRMDANVARVREILNNAEIPFIMLKGAIIRPLYPEAWMRTSCDIDVLVKETDVARGMQAFSEAGAKVEDEPKLHDVQIQLDDTSVELHFSVEYSDDETLANAWSYASPKSKSEYEFSDAFFYYHIIAHMAKHFINGATGVRSILDLRYIKRDHTLIEGSRLERFATYCETLSDKWFGGITCDALPSMDTFEQMILCGGLIVDGRQRSEISSVKRGNAKTFFSRIFVPYADLAARYPSLKRKKWALPFYQVKRWLDLLAPNRKNRLKSRLNELNSIANMTHERKEKISKLLDEIKL